MAKPKRNLKLQKGELKATIGRLMSYVWKYYRFQFILVILSILVSGIIGSTNTLFIKILVDDFITPMLNNPEIISSKLQELNYALIIMGVLYVIGAVFTFIYFRIMAVISQGVLKRIRDDMFAHMEKLPLKFFDTRTRGDIMSYYTNDTDALRQLLSMSVPQIIQCIVQIICCGIAIFILNWVLALLLVFLTSFIILFTRLIVKKSSKYFRHQQNDIAELTGYIEEYTNGQKVIKVFNHEDEAIDGFNQINEKLCDSATKASQTSNMLMPTANNLGNFDYIIIMIVGGLFAVYNVQIPLATTGVGTIVSFINFTKAFTNPIGIVSQQLSFVITAVAGARRIFEFMDQQEETDEGYVTLVNYKENEKGGIQEVEERTGKWAWRHFHKAENSVTYTKLAGDIVFENVDFGYNDKKQILFDINLYAKPGQKVAFVGSTGAGKTTITNLINRFYEINSGKIRYDGINIEKIKKEDLRRSLGIVLQETNLFTGTIKENIRYGKQDATDEEVIAAAKLANADSFIRMLPNEYDTMLKNGGTSLSQGQRQLIAIARAAVANPPVMILDEATSSIDTRTEKLVQEGMDKLMDGRTVFVIAHRLSTVQNSDVIMVLDHGKIIERGTHDQLIEEKGTYYQLYTGAFELE